MSAGMILLMMGLVLGVLGVYQYFRTRDYFRSFQKDASISTSHFVGYAVAFSYFFSIIFVSGGTLMFIRGIEELFIR